MDIDPRGSAKSGAGRWIFARVDDTSLPEIPEEVREEANSAIVKARLSDSENWFLYCKQCQTDFKIPTLFHHLSVCHEKVRKAMQSTPTFQGLSLLPYSELAQGPMNPIGYHILKL